MSCCHVRYAQVRPSRSTKRVISAALGALALFWVIVVLWIAVCLIAP